MTKLLPEDDLKRVMGSPEGRKVIRAMLGHLGLFRQPYVAGDAETTAFNCGSLNYALAFFDECNSVAPEMTAIMLRELKNDGPVSKQRPANLGEPEHTKLIGRQQALRNDEDGSIGPFID